MMMIGEPPGSNPTVHVPTLDLYDEHPTATFHHSPFSITSQCTDDNFMALQRYLPSNVVPDDVVAGGDDFVIPVDTFSSDEFRMYEFKVRKCSRARSHDWTECPYAHPGEKARRRDPRKYHYSGNACPEFRKGSCRKGDSCEYAHGVFECWLHPARYRTQPCKDGTHCRRRICFFAHTPDQLRLLSPSEMYDGSPARFGFNPPRLLRLGSSPTSVLHSPPHSPPSESPPMSPIESFNLNTVNSLADSIRNIQIGSRRLNSSSLPWGIQMSPRSPVPARPGFMSLPSTPNRVPNPTRSGPTVFDMWDKSLQEEPAMERVESGKILRAKIYSKLSKENSLDSASPGPSSSTGPDFGWISELVK